MKARVVILLSLLAPLATAAGRSALKPDAFKSCDSCDAWNQAHEPFRVFGNTYYVGVAGLSSVLIASDKGLILLDGGLPQSAPLVDASIHKLGFRTEDVRLIVNSHAHYDHAGGIAALQRASGAVVAASASGARAIQNGEPPADDPQYAFGKDANSFPAVKRVKAVADGETLRVGDLAITAHLTPVQAPAGAAGPRTVRGCDGLSDLRCRRGKATRSAYQRRSEADGAPIEPAANTVPEHSVGQGRGQVPQGLERNQLGAVRLQA